MAAEKVATTRTNAAAKARAKVGSVDPSTLIDLEKVRKPLYAYVGVADLAVEKLRTLPEVYTQGVNTAQAQVNHARGSVKTLPESVREQLQTLPAKAKDTYADLVQRGQKLVESVRNNANTKAAVKQAKTARSQAKGAATSVRRSVQSAEKAAEDTATKTG
jgi:hypothetical protein